VSAVRDDLETLLARAARLRTLLAETPDRPEYPEEIGRVLRGSPTILSTFERDLEGSTASDRRAMDEFLSRLESLLEWTTAKARGTDSALAIQAGQSPTASRPLESRLNQRLTEFLSAKLGQSRFLARVREWGGADAVQGKTVYLDPAEISHFSGWLLFDVPLGPKGESALQLFAIKNASMLPPDELDLLSRWLKDRPSIYRVQALRPDEGYTVYDVFREDTIQIVDRTSSRTISTGAFFLGRPVPGKDEGTYALAEPLSAIAPGVWPAFEERMRALLDQHRASPSGQVRQDFFRTHHLALFNILKDLV
jgi:hypothetical protein